MVTVGPDDLSGLFQLQPPHDFMKTERMETLSVIPLEAEPCTPGLDARSLALGCSAPQRKSEGCANHFLKLIAALPPLEATKTAAKNRCVHRVVQGENMGESGEGAFPALEDGTVGPCPLLYPSLSPRHSLSSPYGALHSSPYGAAAFQCTWDNEMVPWSKADSMHK